MGNIVTETVLEATECCVCGTAFAVPEVFLNKRRRDGVNFYCPNGHTLHYGEPEADKLRRELKLKEKVIKEYQGFYEAEKSDHEHTRNRLRATKGVLTKTKQRIANGVCPCCKRHFTNLERHMHTKHPDYTIEVPEGD